MQAMESQFDVCTEDLFNQTIKLEEMEKKASNAEGEVSGLRSRLILLQENNRSKKRDYVKLHLSLQELVKELMLLSRRELNLKMKFHPMKKLLTILINNLKSQSSIFQPQNPNMMTPQGNLPLWSQMQLVLLKELMRLRRKLLTLRRN